ncbi:DUF1189 family protein [Candidatus Woesearchaeota archaeon]|nr:DUF1189 family protein [Candidatus Woesearchaeota archaeon]
MEETKEFFRTIPRALNPDAYVEFSRRGFKNSFSYLTSLILVAFLIMGFLYLPRIAVAPAVMNREFSKITKFSIIPHIEMNDAIVLGRNPSLVIDMNGNYTNVTQPDVVITENTLYYKDFFRNPKSLNIADYDDVEEHRSGFLTTLWILLILLTPAFLVILYAVYLLKYLILVLGFGLFLFVVTFLMRMKIRMDRILNIGMYSTTIMVISEAITRPIIGAAYLIPVVLFIIYYATCVLINAERKHDDSGHDRS